MIGNVVQRQILNHQGLEVSHQRLHHGQEDHEVMFEKYYGKINDSRMHS